MTRTISTLGLLRAGNTIVCSPLPVVTTLTTALRWLPPIVSMTMPTLSDGIACAGMSIATIICPHNFCSLVRGIVTIYGTHARTVRLSSTDKCFASCHRTSPFPCHRLLVLKSFARSFNHVILLSECRRISRRHAVDLRSHARFPSERRQTRESIRRNGRAKGL